MSPISGYLTTRAQGWGFGGGVCLKDTGIAIALFFTVQALFRKGLYWTRELYKLEGLRKGVWKNGYSVHCIQGSHETTDQMWD